MIIDGDPFLVPAGHGAKNELQWAVDDHRRRLPMPISVEKHHGVLQMGPSMIIDGDPIAAVAFNRWASSFNGAVDDHRRRRRLVDDFARTGITLQWGRR